MNATARDYVYMAHALQLARRGCYTTHPNPRVGCVIVKGGKVLGEGWHERAGEAHAEIHALQQAGEQARGADVYVTLEPCAHQGRTPPCAAALVEAGVARVVAAMTDPNPQVSGRGLAWLEAQGISTLSGLMETEARALNPGFISAMARGRPFVRLKAAMSLDGRTAMASGESQWITSSAARHDVQLLRAQAAAVLTGIDTVLADDPALNVRLSAEELGINDPVRQPVRVVLDSALRFPLQAKMLQFKSVTRVYTHNTQPDRQALLTQAGGELRVLPGGINERLDLAAVMQQLMADELYEIHVEAGATLGGALLAEGWVDELIVYMAPHLMGSSARPLWQLPLEAMAERVPLKIETIRAVGDDWRISAIPQYTAED